MLSYILILTAIALLVSGIIFIVTGWSGSSEDAVVAIADLEEFKTWTSAPVYEKKAAPSLVLESPPPASPAPKQEVSNKYPEKIADLESQLHALEGTMAQKAAEDQDKITQLTYENSKLRNQLQERETDFGRLTVEVDAVKKAHEQLLAQEGTKAEDLQKSIVRLAQEKEELLLKKDQESLSRTGQLETKLAALQQAEQERQAQFNEALARSRAENENLLKQAQESQTQIERLQGNIELMQKVNNQKLNEANEAMHRLELQKLENDRLQQELWEKQVADAIAEVDGFKKEREQLLQAQQDLERDFTKIKDINTYLREKEKLLQYELSKERAQSLGLERVCEDFKVQIDELARSGVAKR